MDLTCQLDCVRKRCDPSPLKSQIIYLTPFKKTILPINDAMVVIKNMSVIQIPIPDILRGQIMAIDHGHSRLPEDIATVLVDIPDTY